MNSLYAPIAAWMPRLINRLPGGTPSTLMQSRVEVCPPELFPSSLSWRGRMQRWSSRMLHRAAPWLPEQARPVNRLAVAKTEFRECLSDIDTFAARDLLTRIERARSLREMWHLRPPLFNVLAMGLSQPEAEQRLARLNRHFPTRAPRVALVTVES
jgi:hypothetical protein